MDLLYAALKPAMDSGITDGATLMEANKGLVAHIFGTACERHKLTTEGAGGARLRLYCAGARRPLAPV
jgi:hypothetical protein